MIIITESETTASDQHTWTVKGATFGKPAEVGCHTLELVVP